MPHVTQQVNLASAQSDAPDDQFNQLDVHLI